LRLYLFFKKHQSENINGSLLATNRAVDIYGETMTAGQLGYAYVLIAFFGIDWWDESVTKFADRRLIGTNNKNGIYEWVTRKEINTRINNLRAGLAQLGIN
jgi:hypothetical protein